MRYLTEKHADKMKGARKIVEVCAGVKEGENVFIITDMEKQEIADIIATAAYERGAVIAIGMMAPSRYPNEEPPKTLVGALAASDVVFAITSKTIGMTEARQKTLKHGARWIQMPYWNQDMLIKGGINFDPWKEQPTVEKVTKILSEGRSAILNTPAGTKLSMKIGKETGSSNGIAHKKGSLAGIPVLESYNLLDYSEGIVVVDGTVSIEEIGYVTRPIRLTIKKSIVTKIEDGEQAETLQTYMDSFEDPQVFRVAELGIGLNPHLGRTGTMLDEGILGTVHIGLGSGKIKAPTHFDCILLDPTLKIDGYTLLDHGDLKV